MHAAGGGGGISQDISALDHSMSIFRPDLSLFALCSLSASLSLSLFLSVLLSLSLSLSLTLTLFCASNEQMQLEVGTRAFYYRVAIMTCIIGKSPI
jgi:hypothetical protein